MVQVPIDITGMAYTLPCRDINYQKCINMYPTNPGPNGQGTTPLIRTAGLLQLLDLGGTEIRKVITVNDNVYVASNEKIYKLTVNDVSKSASATHIGSIATTTGMLGITYNSTHLMIVDGSSKGYIYNFDTEEFIEIPDSDFVGGVNVIFLDQYFIANRPDTATLAASALNDPSTWDATDVTTAERNPDKLVTLELQKGEVWAFGSKSIQIYDDTAEPAGFPFSVLPAAGLDVGCIAPQSVVNVNNVLVWLDSRGFVVQSDNSTFLRNNSSGYIAKPISTDAMHAEFSTYSRMDDAIAMQYSDRGHLMYQITFPTEGKTWVFDMGVGAWHQRVYLHPGNRVETSHLIQYCDSFKTITIGGGIYSGKIYIMSHDYFTDDGEPIRCLRTTSFLSTPTKRADINCLVFRMTTGLATSTGPGSDPKMSVRYSIDGGYRWSNEIIRSIGKIGEYNKYVTIPRLGTTNELILEIVIVEPIDFSIISLTADISEVEL